MSPPLRMWKAELKPNTPFALLPRLPYLIYLTLSILIMKLLPAAFILSSLFLSLITNAQKVGINQPVPVMMLHVNSPDSAALLLANSQTFADSSKTAMYFSTGTQFTGAIKTHVQNAATPAARMGFFTLAGPTAAGLTERLSILNNGNVGIGLNFPVAKLDILGTVKIVDGTQGLNKVLTSDALGNARWSSGVGPAIFGGANIDAMQTRLNAQQQLINKQQILISKLEQRLNTLEKKMR